MLPWGLLPFPPPNGKSQSGISMISLEDMVTQITGGSRGTHFSEAQMPWGEFKQSAAAKLGLAVPDHAAASPPAFFRHGIRIEQPDEKPVTLFVRDGDMLTLMTCGSGTKPSNSAMKSPVGSPRTLQTSQQGACQSEAYTGFIESCKRQGLKALGNSPSADLDSCVVVPGMSPTRRTSGRISVKVIKREDSFARELCGAAGGGGGGSLSAFQVLPGVSRSCGEAAVQAATESSPQVGAFAVGKSVKEARSSDEGAPASHVFHVSVRMPLEQQKQEEVEEAVKEEAAQQLERQGSDGADGLHFLACAAELLADMEAREAAAGRQQQGRVQEEAAGRQQQGRMQQGREEAAGRNAPKQTHASDVADAQGVPEGKKVRRLVTTGAADPTLRSSARETQPQPQQQQAPAAEAAAGVQVAWRCPGTAVTTAVGSPALEPQVLSHESSGTEHGSLRSAAWWATGLRGSRGRSPATSQWPTGSLGVPGVNGIPASGCVGVVSHTEGVTQNIPGGTELRSLQHYQGHGIPQDGTGLQIGNVSVSPVRTARKGLPEERLQGEASPSPLDLPPRLSTTASASAASAAAAAAAGSPDTIACAPVSATAATARLASTSFATATPLSPRATVVARGRLGAGTFSTATPMSFGDAGPGAVRSSSAATAATFAAMRAGSASAVSNSLLVSSLRQPTVTSVIGSPFASGGPSGIAPNLLPPVSSPPVFPAAGAASQMAVLRASSDCYTALQHCTPAVHLHHPAPSVTTGTAVARSVKRSHIAEVLPPTGQGILDQLKRKRVREEQRHMQERDKQAIHEYVQQQLMKHQPKKTAVQDEQQQQAAEPVSTSADNSAPPSLQVSSTGLSNKTEHQQQQQTLSSNTLPTGSDPQQQRMQPVPVQVSVAGQPGSIVDIIHRPQQPYESTAGQLLQHSSHPQAQLHAKQAQLPAGAEEHLRLQQQQQRARTLSVQGGWVRWGNQQQQQHMHLLAEQVGHTSGHSPLSDPAFATGHQLTASMQQQLQDTQLSMAQDLNRVMQQQQQLQLQQQPRAIVTGDIVRVEAQKGLAPKPMSTLREVAQTKALWQLQQQLQQPGDMQQAEHWSLRQHEAQIDAMKRLRLLNKERERMGQEQQQRLQGEQAHNKQLGKQAIQLYVQQQLQKQQESRQQG